MEQIDFDKVKIECPNTIFYIYVHNEVEYSKLDIFLRNMRSVNQLMLKDIYNWCNRQQMVYDTSFNYNKKSSVWENVKSYIHYFRQKSNTVLQK